MSKRIVYGMNPVKELVTARANDVSVVYVAVGGGAQMKPLIEACKNRRVAVEERDKKELDALAGAGAKHQGVVAIAGAYHYPDLDHVLDEVDERRETALVVVLDSVQDPHNLGAIVRSAHVMGAHAVVIAKDRAAPVTPAAVKASAGATEHIPIVQVVNIARALDDLKERGVWTVGAVMGEDATPPGDLDLKGPIALVLGAEGKGLRPLVAKTCDMRAKIPMSGQVASLNVSAAAAILLYEAARQRGA